MHVSHVQKNNVEQSSTVPYSQSTVGPSCTEFVHPGCWHFDNGAISKFDNVLLEHGGLPHVLPLAVHLRLFCLTCRGGPF